MQAIEIDYIDESEVLTMADEENHINKNNFDVPFVCGCRNLGEALRRIAEGAAMLRTKGMGGRGTSMWGIRSLCRVCGVLRCATARAFTQPISCIRTCFDVRSCHTHTYTYIRAWPAGEAGTGNIVEAVRHARYAHTH